MHVKISCFTAITLDYLYLEINTHCHELITVTSSHILPVFFILFYILCTGILLFLSLTCHV